MAEAKRYYWLKLKYDFFDSLRIKKIRSLENGNTYVIIYLKMQLKSIKNDGVLEYKGWYSSFEEEIAEDIGEKIEDVKKTIELLIEHQLLAEIEDGNYLLPYAKANTGSETPDAERMRKHRAGNKDVRMPPKTDKERQKSYRAKKIAADKGLRIINDSDNKVIYGGNYYIVLKRDDFKCCNCGKEHDLTVCIKDADETGMPVRYDRDNFITLCESCAKNYKNPVVLNRTAEKNESNENNSLRNEQTSLQAEAKPVKPKKESSLQIYERLNSQKYMFSQGIDNAMRAWLKYKTERKEPYKETGLDTLLKKVKENALKYGDDAVIGCIETSMTSNWAGLFFDKLGRTGRTKSDRISNRVSDVDNWH